MNLEDLAINTYNQLTTDKKDIQRYILVSKTVNENINPSNDNKYLFKSKYEIKPNKDEIILYVNINEGMIEKDNNDKEFFNYDMVIINNRLIPTAESIVNSLLKSNPNNISYKDNISKIKYKQIQSLFYDKKGILLKEIMNSMIDFNNIEGTIKSFNQWINREKRNHSDITKVIMFHGTSKRNNIESEGIKKTTNKSKRSIQSEPGYVYLSLFESSAKLFGEMGYPNEEISIYAVEIPIKDLITDRDQLKNKRSFSEGELDHIKNTLVNSLVYGNGARLKRNILPYELKNVTEIIQSNELLFNKENLSNNYYKQFKEQKIDLENSP